MRGSPPPSARTPGSPPALSGCGSVPAPPAAVGGAAPAADSGAARRTIRNGAAACRERKEPHPAGDPLDGLADWGAMATRAGEFRLAPVRLPEDLRLIAAWMNDPVVAAFWELAGPVGRTEQHVLGQLGGDGRSVPCLGTLDGVPMSYWEVYRADLDPLAGHYRAYPHDTGLHLLLGPAEYRGRGLAAVLLRALTDRIFERRSAARRVVAEPDLRNARSVRAFQQAGFRHVADLGLPAKQAALMIRDRPR